ncbi:MAG: DUF928 domain-containing protein [Cyanobacteria bacterium P01_G01_bin.54]
MLTQPPYFLGLFLCILLSANPAFAKPSSTPNSQGASGQPVSRTAGGGTRTGEVSPLDNNPQDTCIASSDSSTQTQAQVRPLVPQNNVILTQQERVDLYVYVPLAIMNQTAMLEIVDHNSQATLFMELFQFQNAEAIAHLVLPDTFTLETSPPSAQRYQWRLYIYCGNNSMAQLLVEGWINRLDSNPDLSLELWHENLELWFAQREENPHIWQQGLATEALEQYADYPVQTYRFGSPENLNTAEEL